MNKYIQQFGKSTSLQIQVVLNNILNNIESRWILAQFCSGLPGIIDYVLLNNGWTWCNPIDQRWLVWIKGTNLTEPLITSAGHEIKVSCSLKNNWLVVYLPLWKILVNWDDCCQLNGKMSQSCSSHHHPDNGFVLRFTRKHATRLFPSAMWPAASRTACARGTECGASKSTMFCCLAQPKQGDFSTMNL